MEFKKYSEIENSYRELFINKIRQHGYANLMYIVLEKIHGSNFQISYNGIEFDYGKRTSKLDWVSDDFYNFQDTIKQHNLKSKIINMYNDLKQNHMDNEDFELTIYGELAGAGVQKGIFYSNTKFFYAFDVKVDGSLQDWDIMTELFEKHNIFYAKELFRGSLDECLAYPNEYNSKIPEWLGTQHLAPEVNICEGNVIKTIQPVFIGHDRLILKNKNDKWSEKAKGKKDHVQINTELSSEQSSIVGQLLEYNTENRIKNVISKIGTITNKDFGRLMGLTVKDILEDYSKDTNVDYKDLDKCVLNELQKAVSTLIRRNFSNILDGMF